MSNELSRQERAAIQPLLLSISRLIANGTTVDAEAIDVLLLAAGAETPAAQNEVMLWARLLTRAREQPQVRGTVVEGLEMRGLSREAAQAAAALVVRSGMLQTQEHDEPASATEQATSPSPATDASEGENASDLRVDPSGGGTHTNLEDALADAEPFATIHLSAGAHRLGSGALLSSPVTLIGAGRDLTRIISANGPHVLAYQRQPHFDNPNAAAEFCLQDLTVQYDGTDEISAVVVVQGGIVHATRCRYVGTPQATAAFALFGEENRCVGTVLDCETFGTQHGLWASDGTAMTAKGNHCHDHLGSGIAFLGTTVSTARDNRCTANGSAGISALGDAQVQIIGNTCEGNGITGIGLSDNAHAVVENNTCSGASEGSGIGVQDVASLEAQDNICTQNAQHGILVISAGDVTLERNTCRDNRQAGLAFVSGSARARGNTCAGNAMGVSVQNAATPIIEDTVAEHSAYSGVLYDHGGGTLRNCTSSHNARHGVLVRAGCAPTLQGNTFEDNDRSGISFDSGSSGAAMGNICRRNGEYGIAVASGATPVLEGNRLDENGVGPLDDARGPASAPTAITVDPAGQGSHRTLEEALAAAPPDGTIRLAAGVHDISAVDIVRPITLAGVDREHTILRCIDGQYGLLYSGHGRFVLQDLTIQWDAEPGSGTLFGVVVSDGECHIERCLVDGVRTSFPEDEEYDDDSIPWHERGVGVWFGHQSRGSIVNSEVRRSATGIWVTGEAEVTVDDCLVSYAVSGVRCDTHGSFTAHRNRCALGQVGILLLGDSAPGVYENTCSGYIDGIALGGSTRAVVESNDCVSNRNAGISCYGHAAGVLRENICRQNGLHGIFTGQGAGTAVLRNVCMDNHECGILCAGEASGQIASNSCSGNDIGIHVLKGTAPQLADNRFADNRQRDIQDDRGGRV